MKKTLALLLALVMLFSLAACGAAEPAPAEPAPAATEEPAATRCRNGHVHRFVRTRS